MFMLFSCLKANLQAGSISILQMFMNRRKTGRHHVYKEMGIKFTLIG